MLIKDFNAFIGLLNEHEVRYLVVGGYAVAFHGHPRYTQDLDVWQNKRATGRPQDLADVENLE
jgi:hypothetical protein